MDFLFTPPPDEPSVSRIANAAIQLSAIANRLAQENRTHCCHADGRAENVSEHSHMLSVVAPAIAEEFYPNLDANLVARYATIHDIVEAYVGDTPTHDLSEAGFLDKEDLEKLGLEKIKKDYQHLPSFVQLINAYEEQKVSEARFVRMIDKWMPLLIHFIEGGATLRSYTSADELRLNSAERSGKFKAEYPDFADLVDVRNELAHRAAIKLYE